MWSTLALIGAFAACGLMLWGASRIEPHWASKDGNRFTCRVQRLGPHDAPVGAWREMRALVDGETMTLSARGLRGRELRGAYHVVAKSESPPKNREIYICTGPARILLRLPSSSRAVPILDEMLART
jgi:hypothetical protein